MERMELPSEKYKEVIIRAEEETDPNYGCKPEDRQPLSNYINNGIINLDKPSGPTSHEVVTWVKNILEVDKTGHGGTLDPKVTGILPTAIGNASKVVSAISSAGKEYVCVIRFHKSIEKKLVQQLCNTFTTELWQRPPKISAVARILRKRRIYYIDFIEKMDEFALLKVGCEAGTYIRKLCYDMGEAALIGANMVELRRTKAGGFTEEDKMVTLQDINDAMYMYKEENDDRYLKAIIQPMEVAVSHMDQMIIRDTAVDSICHGADLAVNGVLKLHSSIIKGSEVAIMTQKGELVAFATALQNARKINSLKSGLVAKTNRVFMPRKLYPYYKK